MSAPELSATSVSLWEDNANHWDKTMGPDGNIYWKVLQVPVLDRLLGGVIRACGSKGCRALELATGTGFGARWLSDNGATSVLATDASEKMLELSQKYIAQRQNITLRKLDVTSDEDFEKLIGEIADTGHPELDIVLMNMAIMDVATLEPLARNLPKLLAREGVFLATILHPVFFTGGVSKNIDERFNPETGEQEIVRSRVIREYLHVPPSKGVAHIGQPKKQIYFHRPIHELLTIFLAGEELVLNAFEEPAFTEADHDPDRVESTRNFTQLPALLAFRLSRKL